MATLLQKKLARAVVDNTVAKNPKNKKELLVSVGYATNTAEVKAQEILEQKGVQEELKALGFDVDTAKEVVGEILLNEQNEPKDRLKAAEQVFKVTGAYAPEKPAESKGNNYTFIFNAETQKQIKKFEAAIKQKLLNHAPEN